LAPSLQEFGIALAKDKLLVVCCDPIREIMKVSPREFPHASNALAYFEGGGQVIFHDTDDVVAEIMKFIPRVLDQPQLPPTTSEPEPSPAAAELGTWPAELMELVSIPPFAACLASLEVSSLADFAECIDVDEGHDKQLQAVLEALPSKPRKKKLLRNRAQMKLADVSSANAASTLSCGTDATSFCSVWLMPMSTAAAASLAFHRV
jgi:hypothetical protein